MAGKNDAGKEKVETLLTKYAIAYKAGKTDDMAKLREEAYTLLPGAKSAPKEEGK